MHDAFCTGVCVVFGGIGSDGTSSVAAVGFHDVQLDLVETDSRIGGAASVWRGGPSGECLVRQVAKAVQFRNVHSETIAHMF